MLIVQRLSSETCWFYCFQYYKRRHKLCKVMQKSLCSKPVTQAQIANILQHSYVIIIIISWKTYLMRACACLALPIKKSGWRHEISNNHIFHMEYSVSFSLKASYFQFVLLTRIGSPGLSSCFFINQENQDLIFLLL